jgi:hypothetical protein
MKKYMFLQSINNEMGLEESIALAIGGQSLNVDD